MTSNLPLIQDSVEKILHALPPGVQLLAAAKTRSLQEVQAVIEAGVELIGYNYIQEAIPIIEAIGDREKWHVIGHLQSNKVGKAVDYFDMIETVDSWKLASRLDRYCREMGKIMPVLIEINSGREANKTGVLPEKVEDLATKLSTLPNLRLEGLMTMGPRFGDPQKARPYFQATRRAFERLSAQHLPNVQMRHLSMGMSNSYKIAIEEGATIIRIGNKLFGERE